VTRAARGAQARRRGRRAELLASWLLRLKGYRILARGLRSSLGEIDIVARRGTTIAFVEVKARIDHEAAAAALRQAQRQRISRAASLFLARHDALNALEIRFDAILLGRSGLPRHVPDAWRESN
jgi:putative endonuclease